MDVMTMLQNARIKDMDGNDMGDVIGVCIFAGRMVITSNAELVDSDDGDDGSKEEVPSGEADVVDMRQVRRKRSYDARTAD